MNANTFAGESRDEDVVTPTTPGPATPGTQDTTRKSSRLERRSGGSTGVATPTLLSPRTASAGRKREEFVSMEKVWGEDMLYERHSREASQDKAALSMYV